MGFPGGSDGRVSACNVGVLGLIPGSGRSPGEGNGNPLQYSCLENSMDRGAWQATVHGVIKSWTGLSDFTFLSFTIPQFGLRPNNREGTQLHPSIENWIKDLLSMALPIRTRPRFPHSGPSHQEASISLYPQEGRKNENNHRKLTKLIIWITVLSNSMKL